jgi:cell division protein FtsB
MKLKKILSSKIAVGLLVIVLAFLTNLKYHQFREKKSLEKLKTDLELQAAQQQKKNQELSNSISYLGSNDFKDQVARQQLDLKKNGEIVYNFTQNNISTTSLPTTSQMQLSNPKKWWNYFFKKS